jgi:HEAT repeat protein
MQNLLDNTVISNVDLAPASLNKYTFSFAVPTGTDPKGTYKVLAVADIPSVKDPSAEADLKVIAPNTEGASPGLFGALFKGKTSENDILARFPGLMSTKEDELCDAMHDLQCAAYSPDENFVNIAGFLAKKMNEPSVRMQERALAAWGTVLNNRAKPEHIQQLEAMAANPRIDERVMSEVVTVAAKFAEEGALPLVEKLAKHPSPVVRKEMATRLWLDADEKMPKRKEIVIALANDADAGVRAAAVRSFAAFREDKAIMQLAAQKAQSDSSPDVHQACVAALSLAHHHGGTEIMFSTYATLLKSPHAQVRKEIADAVHWLPVDNRTTEIVNALLMDTDVEVRRQMAWQAVNMSEHKELKDLYVRAATQDNDEEVRGNALGGIDRFASIQEAVQFLRQRLQADMKEKIAWGCFNVVKFQMEHPEARAFMKELTGVPFSRIAERAREESTSA